MEEELQKESLKVSSKVALGFKEVFVTCDQPTQRDLLKSVSGYVEVGGVTAGKINNNKEEERLLFLLLSHYFYFSLF